MACGSPRRTPRRRRRTPLNSTQIEFDTALIRAEGTTENASHWKSGLRNIQPTTTLSPLSEPNDSSSDTSRSSRNCPDRVELIVHLMEALETQFADRSLCILNQRRVVVAGRGLFLWNRSRRAMTGFGWKIFSESWGRGVWEHERKRN